MPVKILTKRLREAKKDHWIIIVKWFREYKEHMRFLYFKNGHIIILMKNIECLDIRDTQLKIFQMEEDILEYVLDNSDYIKYIPME